MKIKSARGVYYVISESNYRVEIEGITFVFSSQLYLSKFIDSYETEIGRFNDAAENIYKNKFVLYLDVLALIRLYTLIEKRDFYIIIKGVDVRCPDEINFVLDAEVNSTTLSN